MQRPCHAIVLSLAMMASVGAAPAFAQASADVAPPATVEAVAGRMRAAAEGLADAARAARQSLEADGAEEMRANITRIEDAFAEVESTAELLSALDPAEQEKLAGEAAELFTSPDVGVGAYACVADRAVAIRHEEDGAPVSGAIQPQETRFALTIAPADAADTFMNCIAIAGAGGDEIQDFCRETNARIYEASFAEREAMSGSFFSWANRVEGGGPAHFMNGQSFLMFYASRGAFSYTLMEALPASVPGGFTFDYVTEQGRCLAVD